MSKANKGRLIDFKKLSQANSNFIKTPNHIPHISLSRTKYQFAENSFSRKNNVFTGHTVLKCQRDNETPCKCTNAHGL